MPGPHDMGGQPAAAVDREPHDPTFFDKRVDAMMRLLSDPSRRIVRVDENRRAVESLPDYGEISYYERWIKSLRILLVEKGVLSEEEIQARLEALGARAGDGGT